MFKSSLHDEKTFYPTFLADLEVCQSEVLIESPFITTQRMKTLWPILNKLVARAVRVYIVTRDPRDHSQGYEVQSESEIRALEATSVQVLLCTGNHHRKLAIIDRQVLWEGSLNILSQAKSREIMRRIDNKDTAIEMFNFLKFGNFL